MSHLWARLSIAAFLASWACCATAQLVQPWPPEDPNDYTTTVDFTEEWAKSLYGFQTLADLQEAAGSKGGFRAVPRSLREHMVFIGGASRLTADGSATCLP